MIAKQFTREQVLNALKTGLEMIDNGSTTKSIRAFMQMAVWAFGLDELLYAIDYLEQYKPLLKYL